MVVEENGMEWEMGEGYKWMEKKAKFKKRAMRAEPSRAGLIFKRLARRTKHHSNNIIIFIHMLHLYIICNMK